MGKGKQKRKRESEIVTKDTVAPGICGSYESEHVLNKAPIVADLLLIKKENISMENHDWGDFFEKHICLNIRGLGTLLPGRCFQKDLPMRIFTLLRKKQMKAESGMNLP